MKAIFAHRNDAHKINGTGQEIVEIVGERITVRLSTTGKKADFQVADVKAFDGEIQFGKTDAEAKVESNDTTPAPAQQPDPAPLFDAPADADETLSEEDPSSPEETAAPEEVPADSGQREKTPARTARAKA